MLKTSFPRLQRFTADRFSPEGEFGLYLTAGLAVLLLAGWVFGDIAEDVVTGDRITLVDAALAQWLHERATPWLTKLMIVVAHWHSVAGTTAMALLAGWWLYARGARDWLLALVAAVPGGMLLNVGLKMMFHRARPSFDHPLLTLATYSFPSGHTVAATLLYGFVACYLVRHLRGWAARAVVVVCACLLVALVALSRMYLGVHYLSDVLAAVAEGCAWLAVCITGVSALRRRHKARAARGGA
jgi:undecaprenyl-diphosphatase